MHQQQLNRLILLAKLPCLTSIPAGIRVLEVASGRNHMACIGVSGGPAAGFVNEGFERMHGR
jgi:hypothetical protein